MTRRIPLFVALAGVLVALVYLAGDRSYPMMLHTQPGPGLFPAVIGVFTLCTALWTVWETARSQNEEPVHIEWPDRPGWIRVSIVMATSVGYIILLPIVGDLVVSFLAILIVLRTMGMARWLPALGVALSMALIFHVLFVNLLEVPLPQGVWFS